ncbi:hypothetical protein BN2476_350253 [Paraburkholderia piptadeniae]|uniref:Uncharacterized protein n=1 Tax=Paraburkholderia piptadeniae TaxID=1701573 RepID=A0A1N7S8J2_9BURK|nr:hypothetical protein BN2476_350253 [Paraburkholderia piptadeniae]
MRPEFEQPARPRTCVTCRHAGLNPPVNLPMACRHPISPIDPINGWVSTCAMMRGLAGPCGPHGDLWEARLPRERTSFWRSIWTVLTGRLF